MFEDIKDIKPPVNFPPNYIFLIILAVIIISAALVFLIIYLLKRMKRKPEEPQPISRPAHEIAYDALTELQLEKLPQRGKVKEYYFQLSSIARQYLENRFSFKAPDMTTEEFLYALRESDKLNSAHKELLSQFLNHCDMVKFAKYGPTQKEIEESFNSAKRLVDETKLIPEKREEVYPKDDL
ncbi:MAG: hypothetical protein ABH843_02350 [Candidatus Omnitrophota bacterium]